MKDTATFTLEAEAQVLRNMVSVVGVLGDEVRMNISRKGLMIRCVDPAHVSVVELNFGKDLFEKITAKGEQTIGIDLNWLKSCLKLSQKRETVILKSMVDKTNPDREKTMLVFMSNEYLDTTESIDTTGMSDPKIPKLNLKTRITINYQTLANAIKSFATAKVGKKTAYDHISLRTEKNALIMESENDTRNSVCRLDSSHHDMAVKGEEAKSLFPLDYLNPIIQSMKDMMGQNGILDLKIGTDYPIEINAQDEGWTIQFLLAPRIESE